MKILTNTNNLTYEEWLNYRKLGIGGSDAAVILGISPYRSVFDLWNDKTGRKSVKSDSNNNRFIHFGHILEPVVKKEFKNRTGLNVRAKNAILQSDKYPWMLANLDAIVRENDGSYSIFEAKTASEFKRSVWERKVPEEYVAQIQHYMSVTGYSKAYIAAIVGGNSYYCHEVTRDEDYIANLIIKEAEFWQHVTDNTMPDADFSDATTDYLNSAYKNSSNTEITLPDIAEDIINEYQNVDNEIKRLKDKKTLFANQLKAMMQENEIGKIGRFTVKWNSLNRTDLDRELLKSELGEKYNHYLKETTYRKFSIA